MVCGHCTKHLVERTVATKTKKIGGEVIVLQSRQALVCDEHGVVAWDPVKPYVAPYVPVPYPVPYTPYIPPAIPYRPWNPQPWIARPFCGSGTITVGPTGGASYNNAISGTARRQIAP